VGERYDLTIRGEKIKEGKEHLKAVRHNDGHAKLEQNKLYQARTVAMYSVVAMYNVRQTIIDEHKTNI